MSRWFSRICWIDSSTNSPELFSQLMIPVAFVTASDALPITSARLPS